MRLNNEVFIVQNSETIHNMGAKVSIYVLRSIFSYALAIPGPIGEIANYFEISTQWFRRDGCGARRRFSSGCCCSHGWSIDWFGTGFGTATDVIVVTLRYVGPVAGILVLKFIIMYQGNRNTRFFSQKSIRRTRLCSGVYLKSIREAGKQYDIE